MPVTCCLVDSGYRTWNTMHRGKDNSYTFYKDKVKVVLAPMRHEGCLAISQAKANFFLIVLDIINGKEKEVAPEAILEWVNLWIVVFLGLVPEELPTGLLPMRNIYHEIDLVLRASLPKLPHYRMSLWEFEILQKQVNELLKQGLTRERLSACVVLVILTLKKDGSWRLCNNGRAINKIIVKYKFLIPRLDDMLDRLCDSKMFLKLLLSNKNLSR